MCNKHGDLLKTKVKPGTTSTPWFNTVTFHKGFDYLGV